MANRASATSSEPSACVTVHMIGAGLKPREEAGKAAGRRKPVDKREGDEHEAENANDQGTACS